MAQHLSVNGVSFSVGDTIRVHQKIRENDKTRTQIFECLVISSKNRESGKSFIVRKFGAGGIGVERIFPLHTPSIEKIERVQLGEVRRAKLYYLRDRIGKAAMNVRKKISEKSR